MKWKRTLRRSQAAGLAMLLFLTPFMALAYGAAPAQAATPTCTVSPILVNSCRPWLGADAAGYPQVGSDTASQMLYHEQRAGRQVDIVHTYHPVGTNKLSPADISFATRANTMLFANWKPTSNWATIATQNAGIDQMAASVKALGSTKIFMTLHHEPENDVSPGGDPNCPNVVYKGNFGSVADYRNMWQYVESRFAADGVSNVVWVMDYMNYAPWDCLIPDLYPGDKLVDWVVFNGYDNSATASFSDVVGRFYNLLTADTDATHSFTSKPWGIVEWGTAGEGTAAEDAYYDSAKTALDTNMFPNLKSYMIYDSITGNLRVGYDDNGTVDPTKGGHYYAFANDPLLSGSYQIAPPPDTTAPVAALSAPTGQTNITGAVPVSGTVSDDQSVASVKLLVDGVDSGQTITPAGNSVNFNWDSTTVTNGSHSLQLQAVDGAGNVGLSSPVTVTVGNTDTQPPTAPVLTQATAASPSEADLSWTAASDNVGVTSYQIYRDAALLGTVDGNTTSYQDATAQPSTNYSYQIMALDGAGNVSPVSNALNVTTPALLLADTTPPSVPGTPVAQAVSASEIDLSWPAASDDIGVAGYHVYRNGVWVATVSSGTSYADTGLSDVTSYQYTVDAFDAAGNVSAQSLAVQATTPDGTPPTTPTGLIATASSFNQVQLSWNAATDNVAVAAYNVLRNGVWIATVTSGTAYLDTSASAQSTYAYQVQAIDTSGNAGVASSSQSVTTPAAPDTSPPSTPLSPSAQAVDAHDIRVSWQAATDNVGVTGYYVYRNGTLLGNVPGATSYLDASVSDATTYSYTIVAYDAAGNLSPASSSASATTPDGTAPGTPSAVSAVATGPNQIQVNWQAASDNVGVTSYNVYRGGSLTAVVMSGTSYLDTHVSDASSYLYTVAAVDAAGNVGAQSLAAKATTPDGTAPSLPTSLKSTTPASNQTNLSWTASTDNVGVAGYKLFRNGVLLATLGAVTSYQDKTVAAKTTYTYSLAAFDAAGNTSAQTATISVTTPAPPDTTAPSVPAGLKTKLVNGSVVVSWTAATDNVGVTGYTIYRNGVKLTTVAALTTTDTTVKQGTTYKYTVAAVDAAGNASAQTAAVSILVPDTTAPSAPTALKLTAGSKSVTLSWTASTDNVGVTGYNVYRGTTKVATVTATTYTNTGLVSGSKYSFHVVAFDAAGNLSAATVAQTIAAK